MVVAWSGRARNSQLLVRHVRRIRPVHDESVVYLPLSPDPRRQLDRGPRPRRRPRRHPGRRHPRFRGSAPPHCLRLRAIPTTATPTRSPRPATRGEADARSAAGEGLPGRRTRSIPPVRRRNSVWQPSW